MKKWFLPATALMCIILIFSCTRKPYATTNKKYKKSSREYAQQLRKMPLEQTAADWAGTTNFNLRKPNFVIIHHTAQNSCDETLKTFTLERTQVSAHYVICRDGIVYHMLNDYLRAWHAGISKWGSVTDLNSCSIGIELDNNGFEPFSDAQVNSLVILLDTLKKQYNIPAKNFIGHADIAPTRKNDPNIFFPWKQLSEHGFGQWWADTTGVILPASFDDIQALRLVGYDVKDSIAAIKIFKQHYMQDTVPVMNEAAQKVLYMLSKNQ